MYKISIVIPVYNVEKYLEACLDSVYSQVTSQCQVILVDDGSTDRSGEICDEYKEKYPLTTVIHQENMGQGGARNNGASLAEGEYLFFVDSDDTLDSTAIETALGDIEKYHTDIVIYSMRSVSEDGKVLCVERDPFVCETVLSPKTEKNLITAAPAPWNKLIRTSCFTNSGVSFPTKVWYEDLRTVPKLICSADSVVCRDVALYNYLLRDGSTMNNTKVERNIEIISALDDLIMWFRDKGLYDEYREELDYLVVFHVLLTATVRVIRAGGASHELTAKFRDYAENKCADMKHNKYISQLTKKRRLILKLIFAKMYSLVGLIFKIKK